MNQMRTSTAWPHETAGPGATALASNPALRLSLVQHDGMESDGPRCSGQNEKVSISDACAFIECEPPKLMELLRSGVVPGFKQGKSWVIPRAAFFAAMNDLARTSAEKLQADAARAQGGTEGASRLPVPTAASRPASTGVLVRPRRPRS